MREAIVPSRDPLSYSLTSFWQSQSFRNRFLLPRLSSQLFLRAGPQHDHHTLALTLAITFTVCADSTVSNAKVGTSGCVRPDAEGGEDLDPGHGTAEAK